MSEAWLPWLLVAQGVMAGVDTVLNHEVLAGLPRKAEARRELGIHVYRELIWTVLLIGLAWYEWHGAAAWLIGGLLAAEVCVTGWDEWVENRSRVLPQNERVLHVLLTLNLGAIIVVLAPLLAGWGSRPTALVPTSYGPLSWVLALLGVCAAAWAVRDTLAWLRLRHVTVAFGGTRT